MSITQIVRFKSGKPEEMMKAAKMTKAIWERHGAESFRVSRFHTGPWAGEWLAASQFANWTAYGKAQDGASKDPEFQKLLAHVSSVAEMTARNIIVSIDV